MNKSKFLKKSLAVLLAVLMATAMIPLSAAAANLPNLEMLYINGNAVTVDGNGTFAADIGRNDTSVRIAAPEGTGLQTSTTAGFTLKVLAPTGSETKTLNTMGYAASTSNTTNQVLLETDGTNPGWGVPSTDGEQVTLTLRLEENAAPVSNHKDFTVVLTRKDDKTSAILEKATPDQNTGAYTASFNNATCVLTVEVARQAGSTTSNDNPAVTLKPADGAVIDDVTGASIVTDNNDGTYTIKGKANLADGQKFTITSASGGNVNEWVIKVVKVDALKTFSIGGVAGVITAENGDKTVPDTVTVNLPESMMVDEHGDAKNPLRLPVDFSVNGNVTNLVMGADNGGTVGTNTFDVNAKDEYNFGAIATNRLPVDSTTEGSLWLNYTQVTGGAEDNRGYIHVPSGKDDYQTYRLIIDVQKSDDTEIKYVSVDGFEATINGQNISAVLPSSSTLSATTVTIETGTKVKNVDLANLKGTAAGDAAFTGVPTPSSNPTKIIWNAAANAGDSGNPYKVDLSAAKVITVTAEDGSIKHYNLSATKSTNDKEATLTDLTIGDWTGKIGADKTVTFTVPYMTLSLTTQKLYATTNADAYAVFGDPASAVNDKEIDKTVVKTIRNGYTTIGLLGTDTDADSTADTVALPNADPKVSLSNEITTNHIYVVNKNNPKNWNEYKVVIKLEEPKKGNTLAANGLTVSAQTDTPVGAKNYTVAGRVTKANTFTAEVKTNADKKTGTVTLEPAFSLSSECVGDVYNVVTDLNTNDGGVAFFGVFRDADAGATNDVFSLHSVNQDWTVAPPLNPAQVLYGDIGMMSKLINNSESFTSSGFFDKYNVAGTGYTDNPVILVLPEETARKLIKNAQYTAGTYQLTNPTADADFKTGVLYTLKEDAKNASTQSALTKFQVKDTELAVSNQPNSDKSFTISGTLPYSLTVEGGTSVTAGGQFIEFNISDFAAWANFNSKGDSNNDGYAEPIDATNHKLLFVRNPDHTVSVFDQGGTTGTAATINTTTATKLTSFQVEAEDRLKTPAGTSHSTYTFNLKWADPNTEAQITRFAIGSSVGSIDASTRAITVRVPFKTDLKSLIPTFTTSSGATVTLNNGGVVESGKATLDFSNPVKVTVTSEDGLHDLEWTITVIEGSQFDDVKEGSWYYADVMKAAELGWVSGTAPGVFNPNGNMTRGQFAMLIAATKDDYKSEDWTVSPVKDVDITQYYGPAVAYCYDKGYISGFEDGTFKPNNTITREQAARVMCSAANLTAAPGETDFADNASISGWAKKFINACVQNGIYKGVEDNKFAPKRNVTRAQGASLVVRAFSK